MGGGTMYRARIGILGGTFDPIHHVHLLMAREAARILDLDVVLFVPVGQPAHRDSALVTDAGHRCAMVTAAIKEEPRFAISMVDVKRPKPTYTYDTLHDLRDSYGVDTDFFFIVGADNLAYIPQWYRGSELTALAHFVGSSRRGYPLADPGFPSGQLTLLTIPHRNISSTRIREHVARGRPITRLTPKAVARYISQHGLYRDEQMSGILSSGQCYTDRIAMAVIAKCLPQVSARDDPGDISPALEYDPKELHRAIEDRGAFRRLAQARDREHRSVAAECPPLDAQLEPGLLLPADERVLPDRHLRRTRDVRKAPTHVEPLRRSGA